MHQLPLYTGLSIVVATHVWMLNESLPESLRQYHAGANLAAAALIFYGLN